MYRVSLVASSLCVVPCFMPMLFIRRMVKERNMYILEVEENEAKVEKMKQEGKDEYTIKKAVSRVDGN